MTSKAALVALVAVALAGCSAGSATQPTVIAQVTQPPVTASPVVTPEPPTEPPTLAPTPKPTPTPTPKPSSGSVLAKPSDLEVETPCFLDCGPNDPGSYRLTWKSPRTKGVEIRVYGVTKCFRTDDAEGECLRKGTELPDDIRVLLAKGPASKGVLDLDIVGIMGGDQAEGWCPQSHETAAGTQFYSIVVAAYAANGRSNFAIADPGSYSQGECAVDTY